MTTPSECIIKFSLVQQKPDCFRSGMPAPDPDLIYTRYDELHRGVPDEESETKERDKDAEIGRPEELRKEKREDLMPDFSLSRCQSPEDSSVASYNGRVRNRKRRR